MVLEWKVLWSRPERKNQGQGRQSPRKTWKLSIGVLLPTLRLLRAGGANYYCTGNYYLIIIEIYSPGDGIPSKSWTGNTFPQSGYCVTFREQICGNESSWKCCTLYWDSTEKTCLLKEVRNSDRNGPVEKHCSTTRGLINETCIL